MRANTQRPIEQIWCGSWRVTRKPELIRPFVRSVPATGLLAARTFPSEPCIRARLQSCRSRPRKPPAFSPCRTSFAADRPRPRFSCPCSPCRAILVCGTFVYPLVEGGSMSVLRRVYPGSFGGIDGRMPGPVSCSISGAGDGPGNCRARSRTTRGAPLFSRTGRPTRGACSARSRTSRPGQHRS